MMDRTKGTLYRLLKWSERYTKTDMIYFARGNFWLFIGRAIAAGSSFALTLAFANLLTPEAFGTYKYIIAIAGFIAALSLNGLGNAVLRAISKGYSGVIEPMFRVSLVWSIPASVLALSGGAYYLFKGNAVLGWSLVIIALLNPLIANLGIAKSFFVATGDFKRATFYNTVRTLAQVSILIITLLYTDNVLIIVGIFFVTSATVGHVTYRLSLREIAVTDTSDHVPETMRYAKHMSVLGMLQLGVAQLDQLLLWHFAGPVALATYAIAGGPMRELRSMSEQITALALPKIATKSHTDAARVVQLRSRHLLGIYLLTATTYALAAPFLFALFFPQYLDAVLPSQILAFGLIFQSRVLADTFLFSHGGVRDRYRTIVPSQLARLTLYIILIPLYGLYGAVAAVILSEIANLCAVVYAYRKNRHEHA